MKVRSIVLTGGGSAGHVTPNIALIDALQKTTCQLAYIGSAEGIEKNMLANTNVPYYTVSSGKLRRYFSWKTALAPFAVFVGVIQAFFLLRRLKPQVVFSKGGFVAFPVVVAAWLRRIPVVAHESDLTPGLANRLSYPFVKKICVTTAATKTHFKRQEKLMVTGSPIRSMLLAGDKARGLAFCKFESSIPCLLMIGGSLGASHMNQILRLSLEELTLTFQVIHICGRGKIDDAYAHYPRYRQLEYVTEALPDLFAAADVIVSRAGANSVYEILVLNKPHIFIPLSMQASRGDQIHNARYFASQGVSTVLDDETLNPAELEAAITQVYQNREYIKTRIESLQIKDGTDAVLEVIEAVAQE